MPFINVTTDTGELVERINVDDYDLWGTASRHLLVDTMLNALDRAYDIEVRAIVGKTTYIRTEQP